MSADYASDSEKVLKLIGLHVQSPSKDYGTVLEIITICDISGDQKYIAVMDSGKNIDANSILRLLRANRLRSSEVKVAYPDGSAFAKYFSGPKKIHRGNAIAFANLDQKITIDGVTVDITNASSSGNNFEEENQPGYDEKIQQAKEKI